MRKLTEKEKAFVAVYIVELNALAAGRAAKYRHPHKVAYKVLSRPPVAEAIRAAKAEQMDRLEVDADDVIREMKKIGFANMKNYTRMVVVNEDEPDAEKRFAYHSMNTMNTTDDQLAAVSEIGFDQNGRPKLKLHNKQAALESLGKHFGIFEADNRQKVPSADEVKVALEDLTPTEAGAEWARLIADV